MVDDENTNEILSWTGDGKQFTIHQLNEFSSKLLPKNFKHSNFSSFVRQLNSYVRAILLLGRGLGRGESGGVGRGRGAQRSPTHPFHPNRCLAPPRMSPATRRPRPYLCPPPLNTKTLNLLLYPNGSGRF
jgi:hypothetical protein